MPNLQWEKFEQNGYVVARTKGVVIELSKVGIVVVEVRGVHVVGPRIQSCKPQGHGNQGCGN